MIRFGLGLVAAAAMVAAAEGQGLRQVPADEAALEAKLPEIFAKSAAHYRALDAAATPLMHGKTHGYGDNTSDGQLPHGWKRETGALDMRTVFWWTTGHYPGSLWYLYEATGEDFFRDRATVWTELLAPNAKVSNNHDVGFIMYCSYGNARRILKTDRYDALLKETAQSLSLRYNAKLGLIRSWGERDEKRNFLVIPDNLMNLELLMWAGDDFAKIAESHADVTMKHHFRPDGGCFHVLDYDQETGRVQGHRRGQGASCETAWSRGQSWAIYGYTMMYRATGLVRYLDFAKKLADWAIGHPNMPADGIPYWDFGAPGEERDSSAGSIMASALVELSQYVGAADRDRYRAFAVKQLLSLASGAYFSEGDEIGHFLLKHGVGHKPGKSEIDTPLDYGDYYFLEALLRFRNLKAREKGFAALDCLPAGAKLPADELAWRSRAARTNCLAVAEQALADPIPETSDELYGEYWTTGNRTHYESRFFARLRNLDALAEAEAREGKGRFLPRLGEYLAAICDMKSWVLPAHDWSLCGKGTFRGEFLTTDLLSTEVATHLACVVRLLGADGGAGARPSLDPVLVARIKGECERRVFGPVRRETPRRLFPETAVPGAGALVHWWIECPNNWNAVCWDNIVCAACGLIDDPADRAYFVAAADKAADIYIERGFAADGYCSEGMGYWNYGFGHHLLTGRFLNRLTEGKFDFFRRPKQRLTAAYARAYTLRAGASPAFADGNGAADPKLLRIVDEFWPDLPKALSPASEFPDGQVWLFRDPDGLSVAFKGGHNNEFHNHNDLGSYYVMDGARFVSGDPGGEVYTRRTFSPQRYESRVINSYGHPVPVVGGKLQGTGAEFRARIVSKDLGAERATVVLDLTAAYDVPALKTLTRTFVYDRRAKAFTVRDHAEFSAPTAFEDCVVTDGAQPKVAVTGNGRAPGGADVALNAKPEETIENPHRLSPHRFAWTFAQPVTTADIEFSFASKE